MKSQEYKGLTGSAESIQIHLICGRAPSAGSAIVPGKPGVPLCAAESLRAREPFDERNTTARRRPRTRLQ